jgi:hypothetical protein
MRLKLGFFFPSFFDKRYPLQFAKSHFRSPCTPLMWPHHLASIAWLCALLIFDETVFHFDKKKKNLGFRLDFKGFS